MTPTPKQPKPPTDNLYRVFRGGSWYNTSSTFVRAAYRVVVGASYRDDYFGFRTAQRGARQQVLKVTQ